MIYTQSRNFSLVNIFKKTEARIGAVIPHYLSIRAQMVAVSVPWWPTRSLMLCLVEGTIITTDDLRGEYRAFRQLLQNDHTE